MKITPPDILQLQFKALSDSLRVATLRVLAKHSFAVLELSGILSVRQSSMSFHLKTLAQAGLVSSRREGNSIFYRRVLTEPDSLLAKIFAELDQHPLPEDQHKAIERVHQERLGQAQAFFARYSQALTQQQALLAEYDQYGDLALEMLQRAQIEPGHLIELGPGLGEFLQAAGPGFKQLTAVDIAPELLAQCRRHLEQAGLSAHYIEGELASLLGLNVNAQALVANMVLHHLPDPGLFFQQAKQLLDPNGVVLVTELCRHDQAWVHKTLGDLWLGFSQDELAYWAKAAKLTLCQSSFVALRNGFQVQALLFRAAASD